MQALMMGRAAGYPKVMAQASVNASSFSVRSRLKPLAAGRRRYRSCGLRASAQTGTAIRQEK
jgi:hypothetical protein